MMEHLIAQYRKLLGETPVAFHRYMYTRINWSNRMLGIVGPRGVGKTTMMLQHIKEHLNPDETLYVNADDFYFATHRLLDLADTFVKMGGKYLYIDEIHKHTEWSRELKLIYDYHSELHVVFSGSSVLDITKGATSDLSRRAIIYQMQGLSWREYMQMFHNIELPIVGISDIVAQHFALPLGLHPLPYFQSYLRQGYYPFAVDDDYESRLRAIISQTIEVDIPQYATLNASMAHKLKRLLIIISESVPFKPNMTTIAQVLGVSRNNVADYLLSMEEAGLIAQLRDATGGIRGLGKVSKVYLDNTNLAYSLTGDNTDIGNVRETFFFNQMRVNNDVIVSQQADFVIDGMTFEVGGKKKGLKQIASVDNAYIVKDDIEFGYTNIIPLWVFGLNY